MSRLVSIVVPIYNLEKYVGACIESLINQTHQAIEIVLVNDGSRDNSRAICEKYAVKDKRIVLLNRKNGGLVSARKAGLQASRGEFISCVDGDDWVEPNFIAAMYHEMIDSKCDIVVSGFNRNLNGVSVSRLNSFPEGIHTQNELVQYKYDKLINAGKYFEFGVYSYLWNKLFRRDLILRHQLAVPDTIFIGEDSACVYPALLDSTSIKVIDRCDYNYRQRPNSMLKKETEESSEFPAFRDLYQHLYNRVATTRKINVKSNLLKQVQELVVGLMIVRTGGEIGSKKRPIYSLYDSIDKYKSIAVYSAGTFGQHVYRKLKYQFKVKNLKWFDPDYEEYQKFSLDVHNPTMINNQEYDYVIICSLSKTYIKDISRELMLIGCSESSIVSILNTEINESEIINYLIMGKEY